MREDRQQRNSRIFFMRCFIFILGQLVMSLGIVLMIRAGLGNAPWDVFHIGLNDQFGLSIGIWSILVGILIITCTCLLTKSWPQVGSVLSMLMIGLFIDLYLLMPWLGTPEHWLAKLAMLLAGIVIMGYGIGLYVGTQFGAGPREGLMLAIHHLTGWKIPWVRGGMEAIVMLLGWLMGGPVFVGTVLFCLFIGPIVGYSLPQCAKLVQKVIGGVALENLNKRPVRINHHDGVSS